MRRRVKAALHVAAGVAILATVTVIAGILVARSGWFHERVRERMISELEKATNARVDFGNFSFDWTHLSASAGPVILHGRERTGEPPLLSIRSVTLGLRVISMIERKVDLASLRIDQPKVHISFYPDGSTNIPPRKTGDWVQDLFDVAVGRYEIDDGLIDYDDHKIPLVVRGEDLRASLTLERRALRYKGELKSRRFRAMAAGYAPVEFDVAASFAIEKSKIELTQLRISTRQSRIDLAGVLNDPRAPHGTLGVKSNLSIREIADLLQLPVERAGSAAFDGQLVLSLADPIQVSASGRVNARGVGYTRDRLKIAGAEARADVRLTPENATLAAISIKALGATVTGSAELAGWTKFHFDGKIDGLTVREAARLATDRQIPWNGMVSGGIKVDAVVGQPAAKIQAAIGITPALGSAPIDGQIDAAYDQASARIHIENLRVSTTASSIEANGTVGETLAIRAQSTDLDDLMPALAMAGQTELPVKLTFARANFSGNISGALDDPKVAGDVALINASIDGHAFDRFNGTIQASKTTVKVDHAIVVRGITEVEGSAIVAPPDRSGAISGQVQVRNARLPDLLKEAGSDLNISAMASATLKFSGTIDRPDLEIAAELDKPAGFGEQLDKLRAHIRYSNNAITVTSGEAESPAGKAQFSGGFQHREGDWKNGDARFEFVTPGFALNSIKNYAALQSGVDSRIEGQASGTAQLVNGEIVLTAINARAKARGVTWRGQTLGDVSLTAITRAADLTVHATSTVRDVTVDAQGSWKLTGDDPGSATIRLSKIKVDTLHSILMAGSPPAQDALPFDGIVDGATARVTLALRKPRDFQVELTIPTVQISPKATQTLRLGVQAQDLVVKNSEPLSISISAKEARIRNAKFTARDTSLEAAGSVPLDRSGADLTVRGSVNLIILQLLNPDLAARGNATVQASIRGTIPDPLLSGRMELKNASLYLSDFPNGIDNANGIVLFDRNRATIEKLRAETGGGTVDFSGFLGFGSPLVYRLQAVAQKVRVRYPEDVSVTFNATLALNGTSDASTVSGLVTLTRASFTPRADLAQILAQASKTVPAPASPNEYIRGTQFDVRIESGPNFELETSLTRNLEAEVDLRLRGTPLRPALIGTASVNEGEIQMFGNRYTVNRGDIRFVNPVRIDPIFDIDLETKARGVTVNIAVSGTMQKMNVNYSSDPPMQAREIITLLAVGRAPADTAGLSPDQSPATSSNSLAEAGGGLIGQAISAQLSSRLQRFFGASRVKIDPTLTGADYLPQARLTIEQQVSKDITLTYITNLNRTQEQIVQVEWDFSKQWSAVAVREANGLFGIDFQYKKRFK